MTISGRQQNGKRQRWSWKRRSRCRTRVELRPSWLPPEVQGHTVRKWMILGLNSSTTTEGVSKRLMYLVPPPGSFLGRGVHRLPSAVADGQVGTRHPNVVPHMEIPDGVVNGNIRVRVLLRYLITIFVKKSERRQVGCFLSLFFKCVLIRIFAYRQRYLAKHAYKSF